jgi:hypothetical protein
VATVEDAPEGRLRCWPSPGAWVGASVVVAAVDGSVGHPSRALREHASRAGLPAGHGAVGVASAVQRQRPQAGEGSSQRGGPWPGPLEAHDDPAGVADDPGGHMQQPVAQGLGLGELEVAVQ